MNAKEEIEEIREKRFQFIRKLWELTGGDEGKSINMSHIGEELEFDSDLTRKIVQYLRGEGLIVEVTVDGNIGISHKGIVGVEEKVYRST